MSRQGDRGFDSLRSSNRFSEREKLGLLCRNRSRLRFDSRDGFFDGEVDVCHQGSDWYERESDSAGWRYGGNGFERDWQRSRKHRREDEDARVGAEAESSRRRAAAAFKASEVRPQFRRFVTFYFTNFPPQLSNFFLRKGFEVCGMLEEVVVPSRRNVLGEVYGFVKFSNVRDVDKLLKVINFVLFGNLRVRARVARFDKGAAKEVERVRGSDGPFFENRRSVVSKGKKGVNAGDNSTKAGGGETKLAVVGGRKDERG